MASGPGNGLCPQEAGAGGRGAEHAGGQPAAGGEGMGGRAAGWTEEAVARSADGLQLAGFSDVEEGEKWSTTCKHNRLKFQCKSCASPQPGDGKCEPIMIDDDDDEDDGAAGEPARAGSAAAPGNGDGGGDTESEGEEECRNSPAEHGATGGVGGRMCDGPAGRGRRESSEEEEGGGRGLECTAPGEADEGSDGAVSGRDSTEARCSLCSTGASPCSLCSAGGAPARSPARGSPVAGTDTLSSQRAAAVPAAEAAAESVSQQSYLDKQTTSTSSTEKVLVAEKPLCPAGRKCCPGEAGRDQSCSSCNRSAMTLKQPGAESAESAAQPQPTRMGGGWFSYIGCMCECARARARERASGRAGERASGRASACLCFSLRCFLMQVFHGHVTRSIEYLSCIARALTHMHVQILVQIRQPWVAHTTTTRTQKKPPGGIQMEGACVRYQARKARKQITCKANHRNANHLLVWFLRPSPREAKDWQEDGRARVGLAACEQPLCRQPLCRQPAS